MKTEKPTLLDWLGLSRTPDFSKARWLGVLLSGAATIILLVVLGGTLMRFVEAIWTSSDDSATLRNTGLALAAMISVPFLIWRSVVAQNQVDTARASLFNEKINAAANDLHAQRQVTIHAEDTKKRADIWQDDIVKRNAAIDQLEILVQERPDTAPRVARMLCTYVRELSKEYQPVPVPSGILLTQLSKWTNTLKVRRSDMENAVQTLGRLQTIAGVDPTVVLIDLRGANMQKFILKGAQLNDAQLSGAHLQGANLFSAQLQRAILSQAQLHSADLRNSNLQHAQLNLSKMQNTNCSFAEMQDANLDFAAMQGAMLSDTKMRGTHFHGTNLQGAMFDRAEMDVQTSVIYAKFRGALMQNSNYKDVGFSQYQVDEIFYDRSTVFSDEISRTKGREEELGRGFFDHWREWQKSIGFDPDTYQA